MGKMKKQQYEYIACGLILSFLAIAPAAASSCIKFPPNTNLPPPLQSADAALILNAQGGTGANSTDQYGHIGLGRSNVIIDLRAKIKTTHLALSTTNDSRQVRVSVYKGGTLLRSNNSTLVLNVPALISERTDDADQVLIEAIMPTSDAYLFLACGD